MKRNALTQFVRRLAPAWIILATVVGCHGEESIRSWDSPKLKRIQKEWETLWDAARKTQGKDRVEKYGLKNEKLDEELDAIIERQVSHEEMRRLAVSCGALGVRAKDRSDFDNAMLSATLLTSVNAGDRASLVTLLSTRCPVRVFPDQDIEFFLVLRGEGKIKDPILILGDAYSKCKTPAVRRQLADAVHRAFRGHDIQGKDGSEFVKNAMKWYEKNKNRLTVNEFYFAYATGVGEESYERNPELSREFPSGTDKKPLFILSDSKKQPAPKHD
jgi:hypothetical protein